MEKKFEFRQSPTWEEVFRTRFQEEYPHLTDEQSEEIKQFIRSEKKKSYEDGENDYVDDISYT
jgi:hypothetical protein